MTEPPATVDVSVLVVSYNTETMLRRCLESLREGASRVACQVVVADNASSDGSVDLVRSDFPEVDLIETGGNRGFAGGMNRAAEKARGRYLMLFNSDAVLAPGALDVFVEFADAQPGHGIYGGRAVDADGRSDPRSCWSLPTLWGYTCFAFGLSSVFRQSRLFDPESIGDWDRGSIREVGAVSGAMMLVDAQLWDRIGGLDETYFMYSEDIDICARAAGLGYRPLYTPDVVARHDAGSSSTPPRKMTLVMQGRATYVRRRWRPGRRRVALALMWLGAGIRALGARLTNRPGGVWPYVWRYRATWLAGSDGAPPTFGD